MEFFKVLPRDLKLGIQTGDEKTKDKARALTRWTDDYWLDGFKLKPSLHGSEVSSIAYR